MLARVGNDPCPLRLRNEWLSPCAASTLPRFGLEICASCATRGTCIRTHLLPCREAAITGFGDHPNASITRCIAGCLRFFTLTQSVIDRRDMGDQHTANAAACHSSRAATGSGHRTGASNLSLPSGEQVRAGLGGGTKTKVGTALGIGSCHAGAGNGSPQFQRWFFLDDRR
jgi:hypothetical protein